MAITQDVKWSQFPEGGDLQVGDEVVGLRAGVNYSFSFPGDGIKDALGNYILRYSSVGEGAVNSVDFINSITGQPPIVKASGLDANINLSLQPQGSGSLLLDELLWPTTAGMTGQGLIVTAPGQLGFSSGAAGTVTSVGLAEPTYSFFTITGSPITTSGIIEIEFNQLQITGTGALSAGSLASGFTPVTVPLGGTGLATTTAYGLITGGTTATGAFQNAGTGTTGQVYLSGGNAALGNWTNTAGIGSPLTTKGDLYTYSTLNTRLGVGANSTILTAASGQATGLEWTTATYPGSTTINQLLYSSSNNVITGLATATTAVLTTVAGVPTWATELIPALGGTGVNNGSSTITIGGNFLMSGAYTFEGVLTANTDVTFPTSGTLATTAGTVASITGTANQILANGGTSAQTGAVTLTLPASVQITTAILDSNANTQIRFTATASAVNYLTIANAATANSPSISATGSDTNIGINLVPKGTTGYVNLGTSSNGHVAMSNGFVDTNGNGWITTSATANAVNGLYVSNNSTGNPVALSANGTDTNIAIQLNAKGTGQVQITGAFLQILGGGGLALNNTANTHSTNIVPGAISASYTWTWPLADGTSGQFMKTDGSGNLSFATGSGSGSAVTNTITASNTFAAGNWVTLTGSATYGLAEADNASDAEVVGMVIGTGLSGSAFTICTSGYVTGLSGLTANTVYFLNPTSAGAMTATAPTTVGQVVKPVFYADTTTSGYVTNFIGQVITAPASTTGTGAQVLATSPTLVTPTLGAATATSLAFSPTTGGIVGTTTNDSTTAGDVGEFVTSVIAAASATSLTTATAKNVTSISLTAGDWDVWGNVGFSGTSVVITSEVGWVSSSSATTPDASLYNGIGAPAGSTGLASSTGFNVPSLRFSLSGTTTVYLTAYAVFAAGTCTAYGGIYARRRR